MRRTSERSLEREKCRREGRPYVRNPGSLRPFRRVAEIGDLLDTVARMQVTMEEKYQAYLRIPAYKSRGHGRTPPVMVKDNSKPGRSKYNQAQCYAEGKR